MSRHYRNPDEQRGYDERRDAGRFASFPHREGHDYREGWQERHGEERRERERREEERMLEEAREREDERRHREESELRGAEEDAIEGTRLSEDATSRKSAAGIQNAAEPDSAKRRAREDE